MKFKKILFSSGIFYCLFFLITSIVFPDYLQAKSRTDEFDSQIGMGFGAGFDSASSDVRGDCVIVGDPKNPAGGNSQETLFRIRQIENSNSLVKSLNISAAGSIKSGWGGGSAKANFISSQKINNFSLYLVVEVIVVNTTKIIRNVELKKEASELLKNSKEDFNRRCGDEYIRGITTGGEFYAVIEIVTRDEEDKEKLKANIAINGAGGAWSASSDFERSLEAISKSHRLRSTIFRRGGSGESLPVTAGEMIAAAIAFPSLVSGDKAYPYRATFQDYESLALPTGLLLIDISHQKDTIERLSRYRLSYSDIISTIEYVQSNAEQFESFDSHALRVKKDVIIGAIDVIHKAARTCFSNIEKCHFPVGLPSLGYTPPNRKSAKLNDSISETKKFTESALSYQQSAKKMTKEMIGLVKNSGYEEKKSFEAISNKYIEIKTAVRLTVEQYESALLTSGDFAESAAYVNFAKKYADMARTILRMADANFKKAELKSFQVFLYLCNDFSNIKKKEIKETVRSLVAGYYFDQNNFREGWDKTANILLSKKLFNKEECSNSQKFYNSRPTLNTFQGADALDSFNFNIYSMLPFISFDGVKTIYIDKIKSRRRVIPSLALLNKMDSLKLIATHRGWLTPEYCPPGWKLNVNAHCVKK